MTTLIQPWEIWNLQCINWQCLLATLVQLQRNMDCCKPPGCWVVTHMVATLVQLFGETWIFSWIAGSYISWPLWSNTKEGHQLTVQCDRHAWEPHWSKLAEMWKLTRSIAWMPHVVWVYSVQFYSKIHLATFVHWPVSLPSMQYSRYSVKSNLILESVDDAVSELSLFKRAGGGAVCDVSSVGIRTNPRALVEISKKADINIICGTGFYVDTFLPSHIKSMTVSEVGNLILSGIADIFGQLPQILASYIGRQRLARLLLLCDCLFLLRRYV